MAHRHHREVVRITELVDETSSIKDHEFEDCEIVGPAIVGFIESVRIVDCSVGAPADVLFIEAGDRGYVGVVGLERVSFSACRFRNVGFLAPRSVIDEFFAAGEGGGGGAGRAAP